MEPIEPYAHAAERLGHKPVLAGPRLGERARAVVRPADGVGLARLGVAHQDQEHVAY
jgi:hypothetical protein